MGETSGADNDSSVVTLIEAFAALQWVLLQRLKTKQPYASQFTGNMIELTGTP